MLGSLSNNDGDGYKNFTKNVKSRFFKLYRAFALSFNSSNVAFFSAVEFLKTVSKFRKRKARSLSCVHVLHKTWNLAFSRRIVGQWRQRNVQKSAMHEQIFFCQSKSIALSPFSLASPSSLLKLPIIVSGCKPDPPLLRSPSCCCYNYYLLLFFICRIIFLCWNLSSFIWW